MQVSHFSGLVIMLLVDGTAPHARRLASNFWGALKNSAWRASYPSQRESPKVAHLKSGEYSEYVLGIDEQAPNQLFQN